MGQHHDEHHDHHGPFTAQQQKLLRFGQQKDLFSGHHHHHHHSSAKYARPKELTTPLGLYALKKLNAIEPMYLSVREKRLLQPVAPGFLSYFIYGTFFLSMGGYSAYVFRSIGYKGLVSKAMLPVVGLAVGYKAVEFGLNWGRELLYASDRSELVQKYKNRLGKDYLLDVLDPSFRLDAGHHAAH